MSDAFFQNSYYVSVNIGCILYGVELMLYFTTMKRLYKNKHHGRLSYKFFMFFSTAALILITIYQSTESYFGQEMWIINANYPGGQAAYMATYANVWYQTMGTASTVVLSAMADGLLIYRCFVLWGDYRVIAVPCLLWLASLTLGILDVYTSGVPDSDYFSGNAQKFGLAYMSVAIGTNMTVTSIICSRILYFARYVNGGLGRTASRPYTGTVAIIVESALPFSLAGIASLVAYGLNSGISVVFLGIYTLFMCISPQMLILRVCSGEAWTRETTEESLSAMSFPARSAVTRSLGEPEGMVVNLHATAKDEERVDEGNKVSFVEPHAIRTGTG